MDISKSLLFIFAAFCAWQIVSSRHMTFTLNPGCHRRECNQSQYDNNTFKNLAYIRTDSKNESIHYLWSTIGSISVLIAKTSLGANLTVNWDNLLNDSATDKAIFFSEQPTYFISFALTDILEFDDKKDEADLTKVNQTEIIYHPARSLQWKMAEQVNGKDEVSVVFVSAKEQDVPLSNGTFRIKISAYTTDDRSDTSPRMVHTPESLQTEWCLDGGKGKFENSRFAFDFALVSSSQNGDFQEEKTSTMDDEYTPGVFTSVQVKSPHKTAFAQWKPIVYTSKARTVESITVSRHYPLKKVSSVEELIGSLPYNFLGPQIDKYVKSQLTVSFGQSKDGYYDATEYQLWTMMLGLGVPPKESPSLTIILTLIIGLGIPIVLVIAGSIYMFYLRIAKSRRDDQVSINTSVQ